MFKHKGLKGFQKGHKGTDYKFFDNPFTVYY